MTKSKETWNETKAEKPIAVQFQTHMKSDLTKNTYPFETPGNQNRFYVVGDHPVLGEWVPSKAIPMIRNAHATSTKDVTVTWSADVVVPGPMRLQYRYFIGRPSPTIEGKVIIIKWEAFPEPRSHHINRLTKAEEKQAGLVFVHDNFGQCGQSMNTDGGWLTTQLEVRLSFLKNPIRWWKKRHQTLKYCMKVMATDPNQHKAEGAVESASMTSLNEHAIMHEEHEGTLGPVTFAVLSEPPENESKNHKHNSERPPGYQLQGLFGVELYPDENLNFRVQTEEARNLYFTIDFYALDHPKSLENAPYYAGNCHILFNNFTSENSVVTAPIFGRYSRPIGAITFQYLVIRPLQGVCLKMARSRCFHYTTGNQTMNIAHRGMGNSYGAHQQQFRENTIESLMVAGQCGADMVECDVQLTQDAVPVIYHDFHFKVNLRKRVLDNMNDSKDANFELSTVTVKDLTLKQLQSLQTYDETVEESGAHDWRTDITAPNADDPEECLPFPTLEKILNVIDPKIGMMLEIKHPQLIDHGNDTLESETENFFDRNDYLDKILETLFEHSGDRKIILSCFDSDACIMLKKKQCVYPVIFLTQGQTMKYPPFKDFRTLSIPAAIKFARAEQLVGISAHSEDLLRESSLIADVKHARLALFCWGQDNDNMDNVNYLKSQGVDGIITNKIREMVDPEQPEPIPGANSAVPSIVVSSKFHGANQVPRLKENMSAHAAGHTPARSSGRVSVRQSTDPRLSARQSTTPRLSAIQGSAQMKTSVQAGRRGSGDNRVTNRQSFRPSTFTMAKSESEEGRGTQTNDYMERSKNTLPTHQPQIERRSTRMSGIKNSLSLSPKSLSPTSKTRPKKSI